MPEKGIKELQEKGQMHLKSLEEIFQRNMEKALSPEESQWAIDLILLIGNIFVSLYVHSFKGDDPDAYDTNEFLALAYLARVAQLVVYSPLKPSEALVVKKSLRVLEKSLGLKE